MTTKTVYVILDSETTKRNGMVFDLAWKGFDRKDRDYTDGSYLITDVLALDNPWYADKIAEYWKRAYKRKVKPVSFRVARRLFNRDLKKLLDKKYRVVLGAYNASFDIRVLGATSQRLLGKPFLKHKGMEFLDLWQAFCDYIPAKYHAEISPALNVRTSAQAAFRFIKNDFYFVEKHIAEPDTVIERQILHWLLRKKRPLPIVKSPSEFKGSPWQDAMKNLDIHKIIKIRQKLGLPISDNPDNEKLVFEKLAKQSHFDNLEET